MSKILKISQLWNVPLTLPCLASRTQDVSLFSLRCIGGIYSVSVGNIQHSLCNREIMDVAGGEMWRESEDRLYRRDLSMHHLVRLVLTWAWPNLDLAVVLRVDQHLPRWAQLSDLRSEDKFQTCRSQPERVCVCVWTWVQTLGRRKV